MVSTSPFGFKVMFGSLLSSTKPDDLNKLAEDVLQSFISSCLEEVASAPGTSHLLIEYREVLSTLSMHMLRERRFHPFWEEIGRKIQSESIAGID